jgi:hypothetical protein
MTSSQPRRSKATPCHATSRAVHHRITDARRTTADPCPPQGARGLAPGAIAAAGGDACARRLLLQCPRQQHQQPNRAGESPATEPFSGARLFSRSVFSMQRNAARGTWTPSAVAKAIKTLGSNSAISKVCSRTSGALNGSDLAQRWSDWSQTVKLPPGGQPEAKRPSTAGELSPAQLPLPVGAELPAWVRRTGCVRRAPQCSMATNDARPCPLRVPSAHVHGKSGKCPWPCQ